MYSTHLTNNNNNNCNVLYRKFYIASLMLAESFC